jgi:hypothetical protein
VLARKGANGIQIPSLTEEFGTTTLEIYQNILRLLYFTISHNIPKEVKVVFGARSHSSCCLRDKGGNYQHTHTSGVLVASCILAGMLVTWVGWL